MSVGLTTLKQAETVLRSGDPDLIAKVDAGDLPVYKAVERLKARERRDREPVRREDQEQPEPVSVEQWLDEHVQDGDAPAERDLLDQGDTATFRDPTLQRSIGQESAGARAPHRDRTSTRAGCGVGAFGPRGLVIRGLEEPHAQLPHARGHGGDEEQLGGDPPRAAAENREGGVAERRRRC